MLDVVLVRDQVAFKISRVPCRIEHFPSCRTLSLEVCSCYPLWCNIFNNFETCIVLRYFDFRDDDMISNFSHVSDDEEEHRRMTLSMDDEICKTVISCPVQQQAKSNAEVLQNRAKQ